MNSRIDSEALMTFLTVHQCGGVSAAALQLSRTQSAISRRLALLEAQLGQRLFDRVGRRLVLSDAGATLLPHAQRLAALLSEAAGSLQVAREGGAGELRLVLVGTLANEALAAAFKHLQARLPRLGLRVATATSAEVSAKVRSAEFALGLRYHADRSPDLDCQLLFDEPLLVACPPGHALAGRRVASLSALAAERWLAFPVAAGKAAETFASSIAAQFITRGIVDVDWLAIDSLSAQKRMVEGGLGLALMQAGAVDEERRTGRIGVIRVADLKVSVPVCAVTRRGSEQSAGAKLLLAALRNGR